jgi:hypothetical protein
VERRLHKKNYEQTEGAKLIQNLGMGFKTPDAYGRSIMTTRMVEKLQFLCSLE